MNIQPTPTPFTVSTQVDRAIRFIENADSPPRPDALHEMVRAHGVSGVERPSDRIINPPEVNGANVRLQFGVDPKTGERIVKIIDKETGEVIRQVPPDELLRVMQTLRALKGVFLSRKL